MEEIQLQTKDCNCLSRKEKFFIATIMAALFGLSAYTGFVQRERDQEEIRTQQIIQQAVEKGQTNCEWKTLKRKS